LPLCAKNGRSRESTPMGVRQNDQHPGDLFGSKENHTAINCTGPTKAATPAWPPDACGHRPSKRFVTGRLAPYRFYLEPKADGIRRKPSGAENQSPPHHATTAPCSPRRARPVAAEGSPATPRRQRPLQPPTGSPRRSSRFPAPPRHHRPLQPPTGSPRRSSRFPATPRRQRPRSPRRARPVGAQGSQLNPAANAPRSPRRARPVGAQGSQLHPTANAPYSPRRARPVGAEGSQLNPADNAPAAAAVEVGQAKTTTPAIASVVPILPPPAEPRMPAGTVPRNDCSG
jgi:hypothetical protein